MVKTWDVKYLTPATLTCRDTCHKASYLCIIQFLNDIFAFFAGVAHTHELHLSVSNEELLPDDLNNT